MPPALMSCALRNELAVLSSDHESASADHNAQQAALFALINAPAEPLEGRTATRRRTLLPVDLATLRTTGMGAEQRCGIACLP